MSVSVFDLFSIGIGPSSSHTVGPMRAAKRFLATLKSTQTFDKAEKIIVHLYGSLALTGKGHRTDIAILMGLEGYSPETINPDKIPMRIDAIRASGTLLLDGERPIQFREDDNLIWNKQSLLSLHSNGMEFMAYDKKNRVLSSAVYFSVGGGFVVDEAQYLQACDEGSATSPAAVPFAFATASELLQHCQKNSLTIAQVMMRNETVNCSQKTVEQKLLEIWDVMHQSILRGYSASGILPGGLQVKRRAPDMHKHLSKLDAREPVFALDTDWLSLYAIAVNEENAAGSRVVTAPTNGAAGIIPAVLNYYIECEKDPQNSDVVTFLLTAGAIGILYKHGASLSAAEVGCQGEVGVACSMAAAGYAALKGGSLWQIENAAEIGMEHHLGLTCDPVAGLVQIPCIERNAMGAIQAVSAARLALMGDGSHKVKLDEVIATMRQTGKDMSSKYKETAQGGLAVNVPGC